MKKFISILFALVLVLLLCGPSSATTVCYADGKLCINTTTGEISLDGVVFYTKAADGANRFTISNNTAIAPTASAMEIYPEGNIWKVNQNGTEYTITIGPTAGQITFTGPTAPRSYALPDADGVSLAPLVSPSFTTPALGAATATSLAATGIVSGTIGVITKSGAYTLGTDSANEVNGYLMLATAAMTLTLPDMAVGQSFCVMSRDDNKVLTIDAHANDSITLCPTADTCAKGTAGATVVNTVSATDGAGNYICFLVVEADNIMEMGRRGTWVVP